MLPLILLSLTLSMPPSESPYTDAECWIETDPGAAPLNVDLHLDLEPVFALGDGILFPNETARNVLWRLGCLAQWPTMAQAKLDEQANIYEFRLARERELATRNAAEAVPPPATGVPWANAILVGVGALVVGAVVGGLVVWGM